MNTNQAYEILCRELAVDCLLNLDKAGDYQVLANEVLVDAIDGKQPLNQREYEALLDSPMTLRRLQFLAALRSHSRLQETVEPELADSYCFLMAADSGEAAPTLTTQDGYWQLVFLAEGQDGYRMVLRLDPSAPLAEELVDQAIELVVTNGRGTVLLRGILNDDFELDGSWPLSSAPYPALMEAGGSFAVKYA